MITLWSMTAFRGLPLLLEILRFFGIFPTTQNGTIEGTGKCKKYELPVAVTLVLIYEITGIICVWYVLEHASEFQWIEYDITGNIFELIEITSAGVAYMLILLWMLLHRTVNMQVINRLYDLESQILPPKLTNFNDNTIRLYHIYIVLSVMFTITVILSYDPGEDFQFASFYAITVYLLKGFVNGAIFSLYCCLASIIYTYVQIINDKIKMFNYRDTSHDIVEFNKLLVLHAQLSEICDFLNCIYGIPILIGSAYMFFSLVHEWFFIYWLMIYYNPTHSVTIYAATVNIFWVIPDIVLSVICFLCEETSKKVNETVEIVSRVNSAHSKYKQVIDNFLTKSLRQKNSFTAYDFFVIDYATLFKTICAMLAYVVILIQFKELGDAKQQ